MRIKKGTIAFFALLILPIIILLRIPSLYSTGGFDIGFFAYIGERILHGDIPYRDIFEQKTPLIYYLIALLFRIFGSNIRVIAFFEITWIFATSIAFYELARLFSARILSLFLTLAITVYLGAIGMSSYSYGTTEIYALLPALIAVWCAFRYAEFFNLRFIFFSGIAASTAFLFRQTSAVVVFPIALYILLNVFLDAPVPGGRRSFLFRSAMLFTAGVLIPIGIFAGYFYVHGALRDAIYQAFTYNFAYSDGGITAGRGFFGILVTFRKFLYVTAGEFLGRWPFLVILGLTGILYGCLRVLKRGDTGEAFREKLRDHHIFLVLVGWFLVDTYGVMMSGRFYGHYYIQLLPSITLLSGMAIAPMLERAISPRSVYGFFIILFLCTSPLLNELYTTQKFVRKIRSGSPACPELINENMRYECETVDMVRWVREHTSPDDTVLFWGLDPRANFFTGRKSPSKYALTYQFQDPRHARPSDIDRFINDLRENKPKFIVDMSPQTGKSPFNKAINDCGPNVVPDCGKPLDPAVQFILANYVYVTTLNQRDIYHLKS